MRATVLYFILRKSSLQKDLSCDVRATLIEVLSCLPGSRTHVRSVSPRGTASEGIHMNVLVPEGVPAKLGQIPDRDEQLRILREMLIGNKAFGAMRAGRFNTSASRILGDSETPSSFCDLWDKHHAHARVMGNMLAKFKRDGWNDAYNELKQALGEAYVIEGETIPLEETTPVTVFMVEAELTIKLIRFCLETDWRSVKKDPDIVRKNPVFEELCAAIPGMRKNFEHWVSLQFGSYGNLNPFYHYRDVFLKDFGEQSARARDLVNLSFWQVSRWCGAHKQLNSELWMGVPCGFLAVGKTQADILGGWSREEQSKVATWRLDIPSVMIADVRGCSLPSTFDIGFHPESEHERWRKQWPTLVSDGFQLGYGIVLHRNKCGIGGSLPQYGYHLRDGYSRQPKDGVERFALSLVSHHTMYPD